MAKTLILLLLVSGMAQAQQSSEELYKAASKGDKTALQQLRTRAEKGDANAQFNLGLMYRNGDGVSRDLGQAVDLFRKAAEQGNNDAQVNLAYHYAVGEGVPKDAVQSNAWYRKSGGIQPNPWVTALQKNPDACFVLPCSTSGSATVPRGLIIPGNVPLMDAKRPIPMLQEGGVYKVPVLINNAITLNFVVDSGAADVTIPADVVTTLIRTGTIAKNDFIGTQTYTLADGSTTSSPTLRIRSLKVGNIILENVTGSVANVKGDLLLGQSFLGRFKSWSIDNGRHVLVLE